MKLYTEEYEACRVKIETTPLDLDPEIESASFVTGDEDGKNDEVVWDYSYA